MAETLTLNMTCRFFSQKSLVPAMLTGNINCSIFSHTFQLIRMKFHGVMKQIKLHTLKLPLSEIYVTKGNNRFPDSGKINAGFHLGSDESIWFNVGNKADTTKHYILILVRVIVSSS